MPLPRISDQCWSYLVIGLCSLGGHGIVLMPFSYGTLQVYIYSYLYYCSEDKQITNAQMYMHAPLAYLLATGTGWTFGIFVRYVHPVVLHLANGLALSGWMILLYFYAHNYTIIFVMVFVGFHFGQLYVFFHQRVALEGRHRPATASGIYGFCIGLAGIWGNLLGYFYINPDNLTTTSIVDADGKAGAVFIQQEILDRVPYIWLIIGGITFICLLPGYFVIGVTRGPVQQPQDEANTAKDVSVLSGIGISLFITMLGTSVSTLSAYGLFKELGTTADSGNSDDKFFNLAGILIPLGNAVSRLVWGIAGDTVSYKRLFITGNATSFVCLVAMAAGGAERVVYVAIVSILALMLGLMTLLAPAVRHFLGNKDIGLKFGIVLTGEFVGSLYYILFASVIRKHISDLVLMIILSIPSTLAVIPIMLFLDDHKDVDIVIQNETVDINELEQ